MNTDHTIEFLSTLEPDVEAHEFYWSGVHNDGRRIQAYGTVEEMLPRLVTRNQEGFSIFIAVNALTPDYTGGFARRKASQVHTVRAIFADWDRPNDKIPALPLEPTMIVGTSPGKFHLYWACDDFPLDKFELAQRGVARLLGSDPSVVDLSREMRVPGFNHTKGKPVLVKLLSNNPQRRYGADELLGAFPYQMSAPRFSAWNGEVAPGAGMTAAIVGAMYPRRADGAYNVPCPWADQHTMASSPTSTIYWPPGEENGGKGYFKCLHAHCQERYADHYDAWMSERVAGAIA